MRTAQNYTNAFRHLGDKSETVSCLPMKTVYELATLPKDQRDEIICLINDPTNPPIAEIKKQVATQKALNKPEVSQAKIDSDEEERVTDETPTEDEVEPPAIGKRDNALNDQAIHWVDSLGPNQTWEIIKAVSISSAEEVMAAMLKAANTLHTPMDENGNSLTDLLDSLKLEPAENDIISEADAIQDLDQAAA
jgi:hypothetical protein